MAQAKTVTLVDMQGAFYAAGMLVTIGFLTLMIEILVQFLRQALRGRRAAKSKEENGDIHMNGIHIHISNGYVKN